MRLSYVLLVIRDTSAPESILKSTSMLFMGNLAYHCCCSASLTCTTPKKKSSLSRVVSSISPTDLQHLAK